MYCPRAFRSNCCISYSGSGNLDFLHGGRFGFRGRAPEWYNSEVNLFMLALVTVSSFALLSIGVPHGSVLGPSLAICSRLAPHSGSVKKNDRSFIKMFLGLSW